MQEPWRENKRQQVVKLRQLSPALKGQLSRFHHSTQSVEQGFSQEDSPFFFCCLNSKSRKVQTATVVEPTKHSQSLSRVARRSGCSRMELPIIPRSVDAANTSDLNYMFDCLCVTFALSSKSNSTSRTIVPETNMLMLPLRHKD